MIFEYAQQIGLINESKVNGDDVLEARMVLKKMLNEDKELHLQKKQGTSGSRSYRYMNTGRLLYEWVHYKNAYTDKKIIATVDCPNNFESKMALKFMLNELCKDMQKNGFDVKFKLYDNKDGYIKLNKKIK